MPRVTALRAEIGTSGDIDEVTLTGDAGADIATAIELEHPCSDTDSCDIARALEDGYPFWSAQLLQGATETPLLDTVITYYCCYHSQHLNFGECADSDLREWLTTDTWTEHAHKCEACGSYTFGDDCYEPTQCGNCLADLPQPATEDEEE